MLGYWSYGCLLPYKTFLEREKLEKQGPRLWKTLQVVEKRKTKKLWAQNRTILEATRLPKTCSLSFRWWFLLQLERSVKSGGNPFAKPLVLFLVTLKATKLVSHNKNMWVYWQVWTDYRYVLFPTGLGLLTKQSFVFQLVLKKLLNTGCAKKRCLYSSTLTLVDIGRVISCSTSASETLQVSLKYRHSRGFYSISSQNLKNSTKNTSCPTN